MISKMIAGLTWFFYGCLIYTAFNPAHNYLNNLENAKKLYLIVNIPLCVLMVLGSSIMFVIRNAVVKSGIDIAKSEEDPEKLAKTLKELSEIGIKHKHIIMISRYYTVVTAFVAIVILGDVFLGFVMAFGVLVGYVLINQLRSFGKELTNALN